MRQKNKHKKTTPINGVNDKSNWVLHFVRVLVALVFIFSGFVKLLALYKLFSIPDLPLFPQFNNPRITFNLHRLLKLNLWSVFAFTIIMTWLTNYIAIYNPVEDCGCFGDAIGISHSIKTLLF